MTRRFRRFQQPFVGPLSAQCAVGAMTIVVIPPLAQLRVGQHDVVADAVRVHEPVELLIVHLLLRRLGLE